MKKSLLTYILLWVSMIVCAQATGVPYSCSFEEDEDLSAWVLNYHTPGAKDKWMVGTATHSEGKRSLYISADGANPEYGNSPNIVAAYLRFNFPESTVQKNYDISFDWRGIGDTANSHLYVMVCPEVMITRAGTASTPNYYNLENIVSSTNGILSPNVINVACQQLGASRERFICGGEQWQNVALSNEVKVSPSNSKATFVIVFIWVNNNRDEKLHRSGICIDNLQIGSATLKKPQQMKVEPQCDDSTLLVSWESGLRIFEVQYRAVGSSTWRRADGLTDGVDGFTRIDGSNCSYVLHRIMEGSYDVRVRGLSGSLVTNFVYKNNVLVYCPENHCINYIDFDDPNVECTYGYHPLASGHTSETPYSYPGYINLGPDAKESRHTIHTDPTEFDPRTDTLLRTVPEGALASVRLGNWNTSSEAEAITYNITVDANHQGVLIVKYAVVLNNPQSGHDHDEEPSFNLEVLDEKGELIDQSCGKAEFSYSDAVTAGWNLTKDEKVAWKDWTTIGVNLQPYHGQNIKVRFTTYDCSQSGHFGYAYFTLDCANAHIETENCGNDAKVTCHAPEGFAYEWRNESGEIVSESRELSVDPSRQTYTCRVSFIEDPECFFEVSTVSAPRFPVPEYSVTPVYGECMSKLKFTNTSHVMNRYDGTENHTNEPCQDCHWYFTRLSNGETTESYNWSPVYTCPSEGDSILVTYTCYIGENNACDSTRRDTFVVPNILTGDSEVRTHTCPETPVLFDGKWFTRDTVYEGRFTNFAGCDSTSTLYLTVWQKPEDRYVRDSICSTQHFVINGESFNTPMENQLFVLKNDHGCDSAVYLTLLVNERLEKEMVPYNYSCADDGQVFIEFEVAAGKFDSLQIRFDTPQLRDTTIYDPDVHSIAIPLPDTILPGHYMATLTFFQYCCGIQTEQRAVEVHYRSAIVAQKWNDVLTVLSPKYNGGYEFTGFQWYKDGEAIEGENHSYLYQPLDNEAIYYVELTRPDGVVVATCPIQPVYHPQQSDYPTIMPSGQQIRVRFDKPTKVTIYSALGQLCSTYALPEGEAVFQTPAQAGIYIIHYEAY